MRFFLLTAVLITSSIAIFAQQHTNEADTITTQTLFQRLTNMEKKQKLVNVFLLTKGSFNADFSQENAQDYNFRMDHIRLQIKGRINNWLSYNYRQRLNKSFDGSNNRDNTSSSLDMAYIEVEPCTGFLITMGKQAAAYGGYEFDHNPLNIYQYSNMNNTLTDFTTGITLGYQFHPNHQLSVQVAEARTDMDKIGLENIQKANAPFSYSLYWLGSMFNNQWNTIWSASYIKDAKGYGRYMIALGNQINFCKKWSVEADLIYSREDIDTKGILSTADYRAQDVNYLSAVAKFNYRIQPKWNLFAKGIYETAGYSKNNEYPAFKKGKFGTYAGYVGGIEYFPMKDDFRFFVVYSGAVSKYEVEQANVNGFVNPEHKNISLGFIYKIPVF